MRRYRRPDNTLYNPRTDREGCFTDGCLYRMIPLLIVLAVVLYVALHSYPQGIPLIPWLVTHF